MSFGRIIKGDEEELNSLFKEEVTFRISGLGHTYSEHTIVSIDGEEMPEDKLITMYFYRDDIYISPENRDPNYRGSLVAYDMGQGNYGRVAKYFYRNDLKESESDKLLSIHDVIDDLYAGRKRD